MGGTISCAIRFICHIPLGFYCSNAVKHWHFVRQHAGILLEPPLSRTIQRGEQIAGPMGAFAFAWNVVMWIVTFSAQGQVLLYVGMVDAVIVVALIAATSIEGTYVGKTAHECAQVSVNGSAGHPLVFFNRAATINMTDTSYGEDLCNDFRSTFYFGIAMIIMYGFAAVANISSGAPAWRDDFVRSNPDLHQPWFPVVGYLLQAILFPFALAWLILSKIFSSVFSCLPNPMQKAIRFGGRVAGKWGHHTTASTKIRLRKIPHRLPRVPHRISSDRALEEILLYDILLLIAPKLHYVDLVNLSMVSKRIRAAIFPVSETHDKERELRVYSCYGNIKSACWACGIQICSDCSKTKNLHVTTVSAHMELCQARCSNCFYSAINTSTRPCKCYGALTTGWGNRNTSPYSWSKWVNRSLCRDCFSMEPKVCLSLREKRDKVIYENLTRQYLACGKCNEALPLTGPLWWTCSKCSAECRHLAHPGWGRKLEV